MAHVGAGYAVMNAMCPRCGSFPRHRGFAWLVANVGVGERIRAAARGGGRRLLFAPEPSMLTLLAQHVTGWEGVDAERINDLVDHIEDIQSLSFASMSADVISCFHVIEHVPDDRRALSELRRVLSGDGVAILNVPITFGRWASVEFGRPDPLLNFHYFDYGEDFSARLAEAGLSGTGYRLSWLVPPQEYSDLGLQDELVYLVSPSSVPGSVVDHLAPDLTRPF